MTKPMMLVIPPYVRIPVAPIAGKVIQRHEPLYRDWSRFDAPAWLRVEPKEMSVFLKRQAD